MYGLQPSRSLGLAYGGLTLRSMRKGKEIHPQAHQLGRFYFVTLNLQNEFPTNYTKQTWFMLQVNYNTRSVYIYKS